MQPPQSAALSCGLGRGKKKKKNGYNRRYKTRQDKMEARRQLPHPRAGETEKNRAGGRVILFNCINRNTAKQ